MNITLFNKNTMRYLSLALVAVVLGLMSSTTVFAQSTSDLRQQELERVSISEIPLSGYDKVLPGDAVVPTEPAFTYWGYIYEVRDADTVKGFVDLGFDIHHWFGWRLFGNDAFEITKKGGKSVSHVARGFKCRDLLVKELGSNQVFPKKAVYFKFDKPIKVVVKSRKSDKYGGRWLFSIYKDGRDINQLMARSGCAIVTTFGRKPPFYPRETPITSDLR